MPPLAGGGGASRVFIRDELGRLLRALRAQSGRGGANMLLKVHPSGESFYTTANGVFQQINLHLASLPKDAASEQFASRIRWHSTVCSTVSQDHFRYRDANRQKIRIPLARSMRTG
jgi:hypothetical protein